ncbi:MAG: toxin-antitoxin system HicB family antitoxin [Sulfobacillus acidophilus]|uniref:Toxin-antitoxin system HicB family antitoxin n=1 Tax=Sulfobacillus acidophilus TaxID=53633 RepID=A0A2T2WEG7_9FIRM|nr:MAG: toxin-antitoxin system HicB family antitoxin [Sulfobacillus acidophilus]
MSEQDFDGLMRLPYRIELYPDEDGGFVATIPDLPGCVTQAETKEAALTLIEDAKAAWISTAIEQAVTIPTPGAHAGSYSGKLNVRLPKSLHRALAIRAEEEGVSLNHLIVYKLTQTVEDWNPGRPMTKPKSRSVSPRRRRARD